MKANTRLIINSVLHTTLCILAGAINYFNQFAIVALVSGLAIVYTYSRISKHWLPAALTVMPFVLFYGITSLVVRNEIVYPISIGCILVSATCIYMLQKQGRTILPLGFCLAFALFGRFIFMPNYFAYVVREPATGFEKMEKAIFKDLSNKIIPAEELKGKVILFDLWNVGCGSCIKKFPELEALYKKYKADSLVRVLAVNVPLQGRNNLEHVKKLVNRYSFSNLIFQDQETGTSFIKNGVPLVLIFDKKMKCRYAGQLFTDKNVFIDNSERILNNLRNE
jgi:thiol-disulfide isomerase/thioredoxin